PRPPPGICLIGLQAGALREYDPERVQERVKALDAREVEVDQLPCGELAGGDQLRLADDPGVSELGGIHRRANLRQNAARTAAGQPPLPEPCTKRPIRPEARSRSDGRDGVAPGGALAALAGGKPEAADELLAQLVGLHDCVDDEL